MIRPIATSLLVLSMLVHPSAGHAAWTINGNVVSATPDDQIAPVITSDGVGGAIVVWHDFNGSDYDLYAQRINATGVAQWTANGVAVCTAAGSQLLGGVVSDGAGGAIIAWRDSRISSNLDLYAQRINAAGVVQWAANGVGICTTSWSQDNPTIVADGSGGAVITWKDHPIPGDEDIRAQRVNATGVVQWPPSGVTVCSSGGNQEYPTLDSDGAGGAIIAWQDPRSGTNDIYAQRMNASGSALWAVGGIPICAAANHQTDPLVTSDGTGGAIITWDDSRIVNTHDIYAQRVSSTGAVAWALNGVALCTATGDQIAPAIASDGFGGAIVAWWDRRTGSFDIYARRINAAGTPLWTADGVALCTAAGDQNTPAIAADGNGGAVVTWSDDRVQPSDVYAQHVNNSGVALWTADGIALCTAADDQVTPCIAPDGGGGAVVAWEDHRNYATALSDIYALRIAVGGVIPTGVSGLTPALSLTVGDNHPNPFTTGTSFDVTTAHESPVSIEVFDVAGHRVRSINERRVLAGASHLVFDGLDDRSHALPSGVYFYRVHAGNNTVTKKMVIAR